MRIKKNTIIVAAIAVCVVFIVLYCVIRSSPHNTFKREFNLVLPKTSITQRYTCSGAHAYAKIAIDSQDIDEIIRQLDRYFHKDLTTSYPNVELSWWDLDSKKVVKSYIKIENVSYGFAVTGRSKWAFVSKDEKGGYYLYLVG